MCAMVTFLNLLCRYESTYNCFCYVPDFIVFLFFLFYIDLYQLSTWVLQNPKKTKPNHSAFLHRRVQIVWFSFFELSFLLFDLTFLQTRFNTTITTREKFNHYYAESNSVQIDSGRTHASAALYAVSVSLSHVGG